VGPDIERLYREHRAGLVRLVERELHDHHDAEDVVQTAFLDAQRALERGTVPHNPPAWLATIALNAGRRLRRRHLNAELLEEYAVQEASRLPEIRAALANLPREQRAAVLYRDVLGLSYGETAEQMGTSVNAVTMLLHRGRKRLRQTLGITPVGVGMWRWLKRSAVSQAAVAKGAAAVVVGAGLATSGVVASKLVAPLGADKTSAPATRFVSRQAGVNATQAPYGSVAIGPARRRVKTSESTRAGTPTGPTRGPRESATSPATPPSTAAAVSPSRSASLLGVLSTGSLPQVRIPTLPATVAATVVVSTPVASATVTAQLSTTVTVATPITTVTLPIP